MLTASVKNSPLYSGQSNIVFFEASEDLTGKTVVLHLKPRDRWSGFNPWSWFMGYDSYGSYQVTCTTAGFDAQAVIDKHFCGKVDISLRIDGAAATLDNSTLFFIRT